MSAQQIDHRKRAVRGGSLPERFWAKVVQDGDCWTWTGTRDRNGYARFSHRVAGQMRTPPAYRWAWEQMVGTIPDGLELDHLCRNRACVNPEHLEPAPHRVNTQRGKFRQHGSSAEFCRNGHPRTAENRVQRSGKRGGPSGECKVCNRERERRRRERQRLESEAAS